LASTPAPFFLSQPACSSPPSSSSEGIGSAFTLPRLGALPVVATSVEFLLRSAAMRSLMLAIVTITSVVAVA
jgi:hypothetical protein